MYTRKFRKLKCSIPFKDCDKHYNDENNAI